MSLFQPSSKTVSATVDEIADTVGASADTEMRGRAFRSLNAGLKYWNGRAKWAWLLVEAAPTTLIAPFTFSVTASGGSATLSAISGHGVLPDDWLAGSFISLGTRVSATAATSIVLGVSVASAGTAVVTLSANRDFYDLPSDWKAAYSIRHLTLNKWMKPAQRRAYDRLVADEYLVSTVEAYDIFSVGAKGKIRFLPSPNETGVVQSRYYRRITVPTSSTSTAVLDVPQDYDDFLTAYSKWHFLTDKDQGRSEQSSTWLSVAQDGLKTMLSDQTNQPDEDLGFQPGTSRGWPGARDTRYFTEASDY